MLTLQAKLLTWRCICRAASTLRIFPLASGVSARGMWHSEKASTPSCVFCFSCKSIESVIAPVPTGRCWHRLHRFHSHSNEDDHPNIDTESCRTLLQKIHAFSSKSSDKCTTIASLLSLLACHQLKCWACLLCHIPPKPLPRAARSGIFRKGHIQGLKAHHGSAPPDVLVLKVHGLAQSGIVELGQLHFAAAPLVGAV